jgi:glycosyltransferase involved in cell wall biosynthesis
MRSTCVYRVIQFFNRLLLSPFVFLGQRFPGKMRQVGQVITGKRRHPFLSISKKAYRRWLKKHEPTQQEIQQLKKEIELFEFQPKISVVMPVYNVEQQWLEQAIASVFHQVYQNWELCIVDDASPAPHIKKILNLFKDRDKRVKIKYLKTNRGISGATNEALSLATGQYVALLDHDDVMSRDSLFEVVKLLNVHPEAGLIYTDEDKLSTGGLHLKPVFKPDWDPDLFLTYNYICHLVVCKKELVERIGGFRLGFEGCQDYDLLLRLTELTDRIFHIPKVLYHWRMIPGSAASVVDAKPEAFQRAKRALEDALKRRGIQAEVRDGKSKGTFFIQRKTVGQ